MAPMSDDDGDVTDSKPLTGDEVVISGISGVFPKSDSVLGFMENLYNKIDMVSDEPKWRLNNPDIPKHMGRINGAEKFDAQFFGVSFHLACALDPMGKKLLEHTYSAIFDSGTSTQSLRGTRVGVFVGSAFSDAGALSMFDDKKRSDFVINGSSKAMLANRISYWMDGKGPSYGLDYACSSSTACLEIAYRSIKNGECDSAIVGGCNLSLQPTMTQNLRRAGLLCLDGKTKCFDRNADGYVRADAVNVLFLQKAKDAHRIYAQVYHAKGNYKMRPDALFLPLRESDDIESFLNEFYSETDLDPKRVHYVEAHGAAIAKADENELKAISNIFAKDTSVKVGSVKSNMGNSEAASGVCAVTKLCLAYHKGELPANLHYNEPQDIPAVRDGRVRVVTESETFDRGYTALNNFSLTGANFHVVLKGHYKEKDEEKYKSTIPHIVLASGRQESCVQKILDIMKDHPIDPEEIGLLHKVFEYDISGHTGRGYTILDTNENNETVSVGASLDYYPGIKRPLWFVYSGMGSQWAGMGADLMRIPTFAAAIHRCHKALESKGIDLIKVVTEPDNSIFDNSLNAFVGIGAVQIGLTDVIKEMGIVPDNIIGHSLGEMACAYHDDTFTAEELILSTYNRGMACQEASLIKGSMAAVGLGYQAIVNQCPPEVDVACHNSSESTTISGPSDVMKEFVAKLSERNIFAREVPSANIAYHSRYVAPAGKELLRRLKGVIKNPKLRSSKWISTSVPQDKWNEPEARYSSAEYHTNNLLKPVLFEESSRMIPNNAIVVEIAPHGLLQAILKRSHTECTHIPLTRRGNKDGVKFLLDAIGKLYQVGVNPKIDVLYPKIQFPVSTETRLLSHFVEWEHSENWPLMSCLETDEKRIATTRNFIMSIHDDDYTFLEGHIRNGINVLPESAIIVLVWETVAMHAGLNFKDQSVIFRDIYFHNQVVLRPDAPLRLLVSFSRGNDSFEVSQEDTQIANGIISCVKTLKLKDKGDEKTANSDVEDITLTAEDVYRILNLRGYSYTNEFKSIQRSNLDRNQACVRWNDNWVTFIDSLIQLNNLARNYEGESTPKFIQKLEISVSEQETASTIDVDGVNCYKAEYNHTYKVVRCAGVELDNVTFKDKPIVEQEPDVLETRAYYPYYRMDKIDLITALQINLQVIIENTTMKRIQFSCHPNLIEIILNVSRNIPNLNIDINSLQNDEDLDSLIRNQQSDLTNVVLVENIFGDEKKLNSLQNLSKDSFVLALEAEVPKLQLLQEKFTIITSMSDEQHILVLLKKKNVKDAVYIEVSFDMGFAWVPRVYEELQKTKRVVLVSQRQPYCGALGFVRKLKNDGIDKISLVVIDDFSASSFNPNSNMYKEQLDKNLTINILKKGEWGGYYYTPNATSTMLRNVTLTSTLRGDMDSLMWIEDASMPANNHLVQVSYAGLSLRDSKKAVGASSEETSFGMDFSGIDKNGERVMGVVPGGALASRVKADPHLLWPVPYHWSLQDAATVPLPYVVAYYCLAIKGQLMKNQNVLITGGAGALGQALICLCLSQDCTVFTTVSSQQKKDFLLRLFPQLDESKIAYSRDESFEHMVRSKLKANGCDFVINCTSGHLRRAAMKCVGFSGCFLDLSDYDMNENNHFGMTYLWNDRSYISVDVSNIFRRQHSADKKLLQILVAEGISRGIVKPISRVEYAPNDIVGAFRLLSSSKNIGRVVIKMRSPAIMSQGLEVSPTMNYCTKGVYIIICDKNGLGIELADQLVKKGARNIILHLNGNVSGYLQAKFLSWYKYNTTIKIQTNNIKAEEGCINLLKDATKIGPINGIFIVQNNDLRTEEDNTQKQIGNKFNDIARAVINLDVTSKHYCKDLSHFVVLTTSPRNASDAYTISSIERTCQARSAIGLPALILYTDCINELTQTSNKQTSSTKVQPLKLSAFFNAMEKSLKLKYRNVLTFNLNKSNDNGYLEKLSTLLGVNKIDSIQNDFTVDDLKLNEVVLEELKTVLEKYLQVYYPIEKIQRMTIEGLKNIRNQTKTMQKVNHGLGAFYTFIDDEEKQLATSHPIVPMITPLNNGTDNDLDPEETYLTMIPGFEGRHQIYTTVAERLKVQAVAVQLAPDMEGDSIPEIAATVRKFMEMKFKTKSKFYLLGYSFGVNVALELAALLEKEGHVGVVYCLDSSPDALKVQLKAYLDNLNESELQNAVIIHVHELLTGHRSEELREVLTKIDNWADKVDECLRRLRKLGNYSNQYKRTILESAYIRILSAQEYEPDFKLESEIVLLRGQPHPNAEDLVEDYNLSKYTKKPVKVFHLESDHASAPYDFKVSNIINKMLDPQMLEDFKKKNLCDKYLLKATEC